MHKNAIKIEIFEVRGQFSNKMRLKTGDFSAIFGQKAGEFGDILVSNWRFLTKNFWQHWSRHGGIDLKLKNGFWKI